MARTPYAKAPRTPKGRTTTNMAKPYSDDKNKGRRTGKVFKEAARDSEGFEEFEEMMLLNESPTSARLNRRTPVNMFPPDESDNDDDDDDQEQDMSLAVDSSGPNPSSYIASLARPAPSSAGAYSGSISRRLESSHSFDYDSIPSPGKTSRDARPTTQTSFLPDLSLRATNKDRPKPAPKTRPARQPSPPSESEDDNGDDALPDQEASPGLDTPVTPVKKAPNKSTASTRQTARSSVPKKRKSTHRSDDEDDDAMNDPPPNIASPSVSPATVKKASKSRLLSPVSKKPRSAGSTKASARRDAEDEDEDELPITQTFEDGPSPRTGRHALASNKQSRLPLRATSPDLPSPAKSQRHRAPSVDDDSDNEPDFGAPDNYDDQGPMDMDFGDGGGFDDGAGDEPMDEDLPPQDDDDDDDEEAVRPIKKSKASETEKKDKKKKKPSSAVLDRSRSRSHLSPVVEEDEDQQQDEDMEDEIARGLANVGDGDESDEDEEEAPPKKKSKVKKEKSTKENKAPGPPKKKRNPAPDSSASISGHITMGERGTTAEYEGNAPTRRSSRQRHKPLEYWRGERLILGRSENGPAPCPVFKGFLEIPKEIPEPLGKHGRKRTKRGRSASVAAGKGSVRGRSAPRAGSEDRHGNWTEDQPPEAGMDDDTPQEIDSTDYKTNELVARRLLVPEKYLNPTQPRTKRGEAYLYEKVFEDGQFLAGGVLRLPVGGGKAVRPAKDNTYFFFIHRGAVTITVLGKEFVVAQGGMAMVPRGNLYGIKNAADRESVVFFAQGREHQDDDEEEEDAQDESRSPSRPRSWTARSSTLPNSSRLSGLGNGWSGENRRIDAGRGSGSISPVKSKSRIMNHIR